MNNLKDKFIKEVILKGEKMNIPYNDDYIIININETPCYLEMGFDNTLEFTGKKMLIFCLQIWIVIEFL